MNHATSLTAVGTVIREAEPDDSATIARFVSDLATAENFPGEVTASSTDVHDVLFGPNSFAQALIIEVDGAPAGFALTYPTYSTITGRRGVHLEDLFIVAPHRGRGLGAQVLDELARRAQNDGGRLEWWVLQTNEAAHRFYRRYGARKVDEIAVWRLVPGSGPAS